MIRAARKLKQDKPKESKDQDLGFKIYETRPIWEDYHYEAESVDDELFDHTQLNTEDIQMLLITWKTYDGSLLTEAITEYDLGGYTGHYVNGKLYLMDLGFTTDHLVDLLQKIDSEAGFNPHSVIAFGYHFQSKNLRELYESLKSYKNRKDIDIDFITRY